jgi:enoyl-CoA hydratase/carnithine racemase
MSAQHILLERHDYVAVLRMNRVDKKNALTQAMYNELAENLTTVAADDSLRALVIAGHATCFCAGNDLADFLQTPPNSQDSPVARFMRALAAFEKPVIAAPAGVAVGIGVTMLLHCDLVYCGEQTRLSLPFVNLGICPEFASSYVLPRLMGHQRAAELLLLGEPFTAQKALEYGLVNAVLPNAEVEAFAIGKAQHLAALPPKALRTSKMLLKKWSQPNLAESIRLEADHFMPMLKGDEAIEAMTAFMQKRKPDFSRFS